MAEIKIGVQAAEAVFTPNQSYVNLFVDAADQKVKVKDYTGALISLSESGGGGEPLDPAILAGLEGAATPLSADNVVVTVADLPAPAEPIPAADITAAQVAGLASVTPLSAANVVVSTADLPAPPAPIPAADLTADQVAGIGAAVSPITAANPAVSAADLAAATAPAGLLMSLSADPTEGAGVQAYAPKLGLRAIQGQTELWLKVGQAAQAWHRLWPVCPYPTVPTAPAPKAAAKK
jgi:hypothetical protein